MSAFSDVWLKLAVILPNFLMLRNGGRPEKNVSLLYCSEWLWKFLVQAFGLFHNETGRESLKLAKGAKDKWRSHLKLMQWVF